LLDASRRDGKNMQNEEERIWKKILGVPCDICSKVMHEPKKRDERFIQEPIVLKKGHFERTYDDNWCMTALRDMTICEECYRDAQEMETDKNPKLKEYFEFCGCD
jgi:hypothetical protein